MNNEEIRALLNREIAVINRLLQAHQIQAATRLNQTMHVRSSFIAYGLKIAPNQSIKAIEAIQRELSNELARSRMRFGFSAPCPVRIRDYPLALEVPHPDPEPLDWRCAQLHSKPLLALIGKSYQFTGAEAEYINLEQHYHVLVAAMSGGGKSTLMRMALSTLAMNTSPENLRIVLIDLKADDLVPFRKLPHVEAFAASVESAAQAVRMVHSIKEARIAGEPRMNRVLLVIDELAELGECKEVLQQLGRILSTGRSLGINVWAGTQYPTAAAIGSIVSRSFTTRIVGRVDGAQAAHLATQRPGSYAHHLAHPGDFLRVDGPELRRLKAFHLTSDVATQLIDGACTRWGERDERTRDEIPAAVPMTPEPVDELNAIEGRIRPLWQQQASLAAMIRAAYGDHANTGGSNRTNVLKAIDRLNANAGKIIQLRRAAGD